jgi:hypothetical protein
MPVFVQGWSGYEGFVVAVLNQIVLPHESNDLVIVVLITMELKMISALYDNCEYIYAITPHVFERWQRKDK